MLEEARKSWDYISFDEIVYFVEGGQRDDVLAGGLSVFKREAYLNRKVWFEVVLHFGPDFEGDNQRHTGALIIESERLQSRNRRSAKLVSGFTEHWGHKPVFIGVRDISEYGEEFKLRPLPSVVRLKLFNGCFPSSLNEGNLPLSTLTTELASAVTDGELGDFPISGTTLSDQFRQGECENDVIEGGSHVGNGVADNEAPVNGQGLILANRIGLEALSFVVGSGVWTLLKKPIHGFVEAVQVYLRPCDLQPGAVKWMHGLYSSYGEEATDTKDPQRILGLRGFGPDWFVSINRGHN